MSAPPLYAVQISFFNDPAQRTPRELLEAWSTLVDVAEAVAWSGVRVSVVHTDAATRAAVRAHFERELSFESLGSKPASMYAQVIERHGTPLARCAPQDA